MWLETASLLWVWRTLGNNTATAASRGQAARVVLVLAVVEGEELELELELEFVGIRYSFGMEYDFDDETFNCWWQGLLMEVFWIFVERWDGFGETLRTSFIFPRLQFSAFSYWDSTVESAVDYSEDQSFRMRQNYEAENFHERVCSYNDSNNFEIRNVRTFGHALKFRVRYECAGTFWPTVLVDSRNHRSALPPVKECSAILPQLSSTRAAIAFRRTNGISCKVASQKNPCHRRFSYWI